MGQWITPPLSCNGAAPGGAAVRAGGQIRHTTAMHLLRSGVDIAVIALWLGHASPATTHMYLEADLSMKESALGRLTPPGNELLATDHPTG